MVLLPIWLLFRIVQVLGLMTSRLREPRGFIRTPKTHHDTAKWVLIYTNKARQRHNFGSLQRHLCLQSAAQGHSDWMAHTKQFSHEGIHGSKVVHRASKAGYGSKYTGENIYKHHSIRRHKELAFRLVDGWMKSPGHRANMLNGRYRYIGVGIREQDGYVWATQNFGGL